MNLKEFFEGRHHAERHLVNVSVLTYHRHSHRGSLDSYLIGG